MSLIQPDGYLALPTLSIGKGVLVLHPWWGLNATIKAYCDRLAATGFVVFAPDLYHGQVTDQIAEAETLVATLESNLAQPRAAVDAAAMFLKERAGVPSLAVLGFSMGAFYATDLSVRDPASVHAVVLYYGTGSGDFSRSRAAYLGHFAETDPYEEPAYAAAMAAALQAAGRPVTFHTYPGTGHWFAEADRQHAYDRAATDLAWARTLTFLGMA